MYVVCIAIIVLHGTSTIEPMYVCMVYSTSSVPVPSISVLPAKYVIVDSSLKLITYNLIFIRIVLQNTDLKNPVLVLGFGLGL